MPARRGPCSSLCWQLTGPPLSPCQQKRGANDASINMTGNVFDFRSNFEEKHTFISMVFLQPKFVILIELILLFLATTSIFLQIDILHMK